MDSAANAKPGLSRRHIAPSQSMANGRSKARTFAVSVAAPSADGCIQAIRPETEGPVEREEESRWIGSRIDRYFLLNFLAFRKACPTQSTLGHSVSRQYFARHKADTTNCPLRWEVIDGGIDINFCKRGSVSPRGLREKSAKGKFIQPTPTVRWLRPTEIDPIMRTKERRQVLWKRRRRGGHPCMRHALAPGKQPHSERVAHKQTTERCLRRWRVSETLLDSTAIQPDPL